MGVLIRARIKLLGLLRRAVGTEQLGEQAVYLSARLDGITHLLGARFDSIDERIVAIHLDVRGYRERADEMRDATGEARDAMVSAAGSFGAEVARLDQTHALLARELAHRLIHASLDEGLAGVDQGVADLLNFSESSRGFRADVGLWLNPPVVVEYSEGGARVGAINERIVEAPFVMASIADLPAGSRIIDVGADESTVALSLASLGYAVTAVDLNGYPFDHPNLTAVTSLIEDFTPAAPFDAVICLSSIEHFGLGAYGPDSHDMEADVAALSRLREMTRPGGRLVLTTPYGEASVNALERTYDDEGLTRLLAAWGDATVTIAVKRDAVTWSPRGEDEVVPPGVLQVALVRAVASP